ncbi:CBS domain-containing protein [Paraburkholderia sp. BR10882]|uniref:CBS domain-containing protein n=2 Tax=unclassified Paraburkholderia TaxID=2615204 RepID=UPI0034CEB3A1
MSTPALVADGADDIWLLAKRMRLHGVRRLPVTGEDGGLIGVVSLDDLQLARRAPISTCAIAARDMRADAAVEKVSRFVLTIKDALGAREREAAAR